MENVLQIQRIYNYIFFFTVLAPIVGIWMRLNELIVEYGFGMISNSFLTPQGIAKSCVMGIIMGIVAALIVILVRKKIYRHFVIVFLVVALINIMRSIYIIFQFKLEMSEVTLIAQLSLCNSIATALCVLPFSTFRRLYTSPSQLH